MHPHAHESGAVPGLRKLAMRGLVVLLLDWAALLLLGALLSGFDVHGPAGALVTAVIAAALNALVWPTLSRLALPLSVLTLGGASLVLNGGLVAIAAAISPGASIDGWFAGVVVAAGLAIITTTASALLAIDDDDTWQRNVVRRQARACRGDRVGRPRRGVPGDRRPGVRGPPACAARRQRARDGALAARGHPPARALGDRLVVADRGVPGRAPARRQRRHAGLPLVGEGPRPRDRDQPPARRRRSSNAATPTGAGCCTRTAPAARTSSRATPRTRCSP